jgi:hypothetical protein
MSAVGSLLFVLCVLAFVIIVFRLNVRLFNATKRFSWLPMQRSYVARAMFDRQLADTFAAELIGLVTILAILIGVLPSGAK